MTPVTVVPSVPFDRRRNPYPPRGSSWETTGVMSRVLFRDRCQLSSSWKSPGSCKKRTQSTTERGTVLETTEDHFCEVFPPYVTPQRRKSGKRRGRVKRTNSPYVYRPGFTPTLRSLKQKSLWTQRRGKKDIRKGVGGFHP